MSREKNLLKNTLIISIGKICTQVITFFLLPLYTYILSTEEYGIVDLLNTLVSLLLPIITFQIEQSVFRELIEYRGKKEKEKEVISNGIFSVIIQCAIYLLLFLIISPFIKNDYKIFLATNVIVYIFLSLFQQISRGLGDNGSYTIASFLSAITTIGFNIFFLVFLKWRVNGMLLGTMLGQISGMIYLFFSLKLNKRVSPKLVCYTTIKKLWKYSIPLIPNAISWWIFNASDKLIVSIFLGLSANGILSASHKFSAVYISFYNIFNMSWTESISLHIKDKDIETYFNKTFNIVLQLFTSLAVIIIAIMPFVYPIIINNKFSSGYHLVPILILASLFNIIVGLISTLYVANKNTKAIANTSIISAITNIIIHLCLIKWIGLYAAVISTLAAFFIMCIYRYYDIKKKYIKIKISKTFIIKTLIIMSFILLTYYLNSFYLNIVSLLIAICFGVIMNNKSIHFILKIIKDKDKRK